MIPASPVESVVAHLKSVVAQGTDELEKCLIAIVAADGIRPYLAGIVGDNAEISRVARRSCWHPNGFAKLVLHRSEHCAVRLHVWPADRPKNGDSEAHSHRWDFASMVLAGGLSILESEESATEGKIYVRCSYDGTRVQPERPARLVPTDFRTVLRGEHYVTAHDVVHMVHPHPDGPVATLLLQGPHRNDTTVVYRVGPDPEPARPMTAPEVRSLLRAVLRALAS